MNRLPTKEEFLKIFGDPADYEPSYSYDYSQDKGKDINPYDFMYLDEKIKKPGGLPEILSNLIDDLIRYYHEGMYRHFEIEVENLEGLTKNYHSVDEISDEQAKTIFKMFGWHW